MKKEYENLEKFYKFSYDSQTKFKDKFFDFSKKILSLSMEIELIGNDYKFSKFTFKNPFSIFFYYQFISNSEKRLNLSKNNFEKILNKYKLNLEKEYYRYLNNYILFKNEKKQFILSNIDEKTIHFLFEKLEKLNLDEKKYIDSLLYLDYNNYYLLRKKFTKVYFEIIDNLKDIELIIKNSHNYLNKFEITDFKKISISDLKKGDIIIEQIRNNYSDFKGKFISYFLNSPIIHVSMVYQIKNNDLYIFEANTKLNKFNSKISKFEFEDNIDYLILRYSKNISSKQLKLMDNYIEKQIAIPYSKLKTLGIIHHKLNFFLSENLKFPIKRPSNPFRFSKGNFCSELIVNTYENIGIRIVPLKNTSMVFPLDIINSKDFEIIGIL